MPWEEGLGVLHRLTCEVLSSEVSLETVSPLAHLCCASSTALSIISATFPSLSVHGNKYFFLIPVLSSCGWCMKLIIRQIMTCLNKGAQAPDTWLAGLLSIRASLWEVGPTGLFLIQGAISVPHTERRVTGVVLTDPRNWQGHRELVEGWPAAPGSEKQAPGICC